MIPIVCGGNREGFVFAHPPAPDGNRFANTGRHKPSSLVLHSAGKYLILLVSALGSNPGPRD